MTKIETIMSSTINELENCLEEVKKEVEDSIGHNDFDEEGLWQKQYFIDIHFCDDMFKSVHYHIKAVLDSMRITVLQIFYDHAKNEDVELERPWPDGDLDLCQPCRTDTVTSKNDHIPREVVLKIPNVNEIPVCKVCSNK